MKKKEEKTFNLVMEVKHSEIGKAKAKKPPKKLAQRALPTSFRDVFFPLYQRKRKQSMEIHSSSSSSQAPVQEEQKSPEEMQLEFSARSMLDLTNKVDRFEEFGMLTPGDDKTSVNAFSESYRKCKAHLKIHDFEKSLYPPNVVRQAEKEGTMPKCVFLPSRALIRDMMRRVVEFENSYVPE